MQPALANRTPEHATMDAVTVDDVLIVYHLTGKR